MSDDVVVVYRPPNMIVANMMKGVLEDEGIEVSLRSLQMPMYDSTYQTATGCWGEILVRKEDADKARKIIEQYLKGLDDSEKE